MKKRILLIAGGLAAAILVFWGIRNLGLAPSPFTREPSPTWEPYLRSLDIQREDLFVQADDGVRIQAELFIPNGGSERKAAVVWTPGSSDGAYHNYSWGLIETYVLDVFIARDMAVLLTNKRGVGESEGNFYRNGIEGRADDIYAAVQALQGHASIDAARIGLIGHSQGGWVVTQAAAQHKEIAFFISLAGPTTSVWDNAKDNYRHAYRCEGYSGAELEKKIRNNVRLTRIGNKIGELTRSGSLYHNFLLFGYDPADALRTVQSPGLLLYAENDDQVTPQLNLDRLDELFDGNPPDHLTTVVLGNATHAFRLVDDPCDSWVNVAEKPRSEELAVVLDDWLEAQGYSPSGVQESS